MKRRNFLSALAVPFLIPFIGKTETKQIQFNNTSKISGDPNFDWDIIVDQNGTFTKIPSNIPWIACACGYQHYSKVGDVAELEICPACKRYYHIKFVKCYFKYKNCYFNNPKLGFETIKISHV